MTLIRQQNPIDVTFSKEEACIVITEEKAYFNEQNGNLDDIHVTIDIAHIDTLIDALERAKKSIIED